MTFPSGNSGKAVPDLTSEEEKISSILSKIEGVGDVSIVITYHSDEKHSKGVAKGAVVTADGADNIKIKNDLSEAVQAALDLPAHKVKVYKRIKKG